MTIWLILYFAKRDSIENKWFNTFNALHFPSQCVKLSPSSMLRGIWCTEEEIYTTVSKGLLTKSMVSAMNNNMLFILEQSFYYVNVLFTPFMPVQ